MNLSPHSREPGLPSEAVAVCAFSSGGLWFAPCCVGQDSSRQGERRSGALERGGVVEWGPSTLWVGSLWSSVVICAGT